MFRYQSVAATAAIGMLLTVALAGCGASQSHHAQQSHKTEPPTASPNGVPLPPGAHLSAGKLPILVPADLRVKSTMDSSSAPGRYNVTVLTTAGVQISFGGQHYASPGIADQQLLNLAIVSPGRGLADPLGAAIVARKYPKQHLITWTQGHWIIEVTDAPKADLSALQAPAKTIAKLLKPGHLPVTAHGVLHWTVASKGQDTIALYWTKGPAVYHVMEQHGHNAEAAISMAASMVTIP